MIVVRNLRKKQVGVISGEKLVSWLSIDVLKAGNHFCLSPCGQRISPLEAKYHFLTQEVLLNGHRRGIEVVES